MLNQRIALRGRLHFAVGHHLRAFCQAFLLEVYRLDRRLRELHIHADAAVVDLLVTMPERQLCALIIPLRQTLMHFAHGLDIQPGVSNKAPPFFRVGFAGGPAQFAVLRTWLTEQLDKRFTFFVLRLVLRDAQHLTECAQRAGEAVRQRLHHRVAPASDIGCQLRHCMAQHRAVEM